MPSRPFVHNARIQHAIQVGNPDLPERFLRAYQRGGTPPAAHLRTIADAANTTPIWLMTGRPAKVAPGTWTDGEA